MKHFFITFCVIFLCISGVFATSFTDDADITQSTAVTMLTDLGIFAGYEDGSFRPNNTISRGEIAKVMTVLSTDTVSTSDGQTFLDTQDSWAVDYIAYCAENGIISGSDGYFRPNDNLTARELAKMILVVLGEDESQFVGDYWADNVENIGNKWGIFTGYEKELDLYISRENTALLINNALQCFVIQGYDDEGSEIYVLDDMRNPKTLLEIRFNTIVVQGVLEANSVHDLRTVATDMDENTIHIQGYTKDFLVSEQIASDNSILGHKITVYAIFGTDYNRIVGTATASNSEIVIPCNSVQELGTIMDYTALTFTAETKFFKDFSPVSEGYMIQNQDNITNLTIIDHEDDNQVDYIFMEEIAENP